MPSRSMLCEWEGEGMEGGKENDFIDLSTVQILCAR